MTDIENKTVQPTKKNKKKFDIKLILEIVVEAVVLCVLFSVFICTAHVTGQSMEPTYSDGTFLIASRLSTPHVGDIVLARDDEFGVIVKRVIAEGGDTIEIQDGNVYLNRERVDEPYVKYPDMSETMTEVTVPESEYFLAGDNRANSIDSRSGLGTITKDDIIGVVFFDIF